MLSRIVGKNKGSLPQNVIAVVKAFIGLTSAILLLMCQETWYWSGLWPKTQGEASLLSQSNPVTDKSCNLTTRLEMYDSVHAIAGSAGIDLVTQENFFKVCQEKFL